MQVRTKDLSPTRMSITFTCCHFSMADTLCDIMDRLFFRVGNKADNEKRLCWHMNN